MNLYRNFIVIFLCLFVNYGYKPVESVLKISHGSPSTPSEASEGSQSLPAEGASTTPSAHGTSSVPSERQEITETLDSEEDTESTDPSSDGAAKTPPPKSEDSASTTPTKKASETHSSTSSTITSGTGQTLPSPSPIRTSTPKNGVDINIKSDTKSKDKFVYEKVGEYVTYTAKDNNAFKLVKEGSTEIWKESDSRNYSGRVEVEHMVDEGKVVTIYLDGNKTRVFKKDAKNQPWNEIDLSKVTRSSINIDFPYESYFYKNELKNNIRTFTAKKGFLFNCANEYINNQKVEIWKTDDESEYVNKIEIDLMNNDTKAVTICFHDNKTKVYKKQSKNESWNEIYISKVNPMLVDITDDKETYFYLNKLDKNVKTFEAKNGFAFNVVSDCVNNNNVEIWKTDKESEYVNKIEMDLMDNNSKAVKIYFPENKTKVFMKDGKTEPWKEIDTDKVNLTSVNIQYQYDSYFYTNILVNEVRTFEPRDGFVFNGLREGDTVIWTTTDQSEYANKIVSAKRSVGKIDVTVKLGNGKKKLFVKEDANEQWKEIDLTVINPRSMNIRYDKETYFYSNNLDKDVRTFEAQDGFAFNVVNEYIGNNKKEIWKTDKENEYAKKVVSAKRSSGIFDVTINLTNGAKKLFIKESDNDPWKEIDITKVNPMPVNITDCEETHFYSNKLLGSTRTFEARDGFAFNVVNEGSGSNKAEIWKTTNDNEYANKVVSAKRSSGIFDVTINLTNGTKKLFLKEPDKQWKEIDITKVNPMPVNITDREETHFYSNKMLGSTRTFEARDGFAFNAVNEQIGSNKVEIWKTTNVEEYAKKVEYPKRSSGMLDITIDLSNGKKKLFVKDTEDEGWKEIDINKVNPKSVNIQDRYHSYFYTTSFNNDVRTFTAKTGFLFDSVFEYVSGNRVEVWKTDKENEYAKKVVARENKVTIYIGDDGTAKAFNKGSEGKWEEDTTTTTPESDTSTQPIEDGSGQPGEQFKSSTPPASESSTQSQVKLYKANPSDAANPLELEANEYTSTTSGNVAIYHINVDCVQLMLDSVLLWAHDTAYHGGIYPKSVYHDTSSDVLLLRFEGLDTTFQNTNEGWIFTESGPLAVKFHIVDPNDSNNSVELPRDQITVNTNGDITTFTIANGVNCVKLMYGYVLLWLHDPNQHDGKYPKSLYYNKSTDTLLLRFDGVDLTFAKNTDGQWEYTETTSAGGAATQSQVKLYKANPSDAANPLELEANEYTSTTSGNVAIYHINVDCVQLMLDSVLLWAHDTAYHGGIYPKSVYHDTSSDVLLLRFEGLDTTFQNTNEGWIFTESGPLAVKFHIVDPNDSNNSVELPRDQITVNTNGDITTFTIANGVNCVKLMYGYVLLWLHDPNQHDGKYPKSLYYNKSTDTLLLRFDGVDLTFAKNTDGQWEYTETTSAGGAATQSQVKLYKANPSDAANPLELEANEYTSTTSGNVAIYHINVDCVQLMLDSVLLWAHDTAYHGGIYPKSVYHDTSSDVLLLRFEGLDTTFQNTNEGWIFTESGPLAVKFHIVDPNDSNNSVELPRDQITVNTNGDITTFTIANGVNCVKLMYGYVLLWLHDPNQHDGKYPKSLYYNKSTDTLLLRFDGVDLTFAKNTDGQWEYTETTSAGGAATTPEDQGESSTQPEEGATITSALESDDESGASTQQKSNT